MDKTFHKGLLLLEALAHSDRPRGVTELARELGWNKSNVHRSLATLVSLGYVRKNPETGGYEMSLRLWELGSRIINRLSLKPAAFPFMQRLAERTRETVHLSILDGLDVVYVDKIDSPEPVRAYSTVGGRAPAYCVATGKAMLAFQPDAVLAGLRFSNLKAHTEWTITKKEAFLEEMERIRQTGYSVNRGEWRSAVRGLAAPIFGAGNRPVAAIGLSGPRARLNEGRTRQFVPLILAAGEAISREFGYTADAYPPKVGGLR
jgi:DNA-binding IclR family transcriptional regulator